MPVDEAPDGVASLDLADFDLAAMSFAGQADFILDLGGIIDTITTTVVPEPGTAWMLGIGIAVLAMRRQRSS